MAGFAILYARLFARVQRAAQTGMHGSLAGKIAVGLALVLFGTLYVAWPLVATLQTPDGYVALRERIAREANRGVPVVVFPADSFWQPSHYAADNAYWFLLDREVADNAESDSFARSEYAFSWALRGFYPALHLVSTEAFLQRTPAFITNANEETAWYKVRLRGNPAFAPQPVTGLSLPPDDRWFVRVEANRR